MKRPLEILVPMVVLGAGAVLFVGAGVLRDPGSIVFPVVLAVLAGLAVAGLATRWHSAAMAAFVVSGVVGLAHVLIALGDLPWPYRVLSGVLAAAHFYAGVLVLTKPAREHLQGVTGA